MKSSWRVIASGLLFAAAVWVFALREARQTGAPPPEWHVNAEAGFRIRPPTGWDNRTDDRDGSVLAPSTQPVDGFATLIVSTRLAIDEDPMSYLRDVVVRPPSGPIRELKWLREEKTTMSDGSPAALGEFTQIYRGMPVHGWMLFTVRDGKLLQAVGTVPHSAASRAESTILRAVKSVQTL